MGKKVREYKAGDFIFAKVKGYPAWPARVQRLNGKKYFVYFYGTGETANLPPTQIFDYVENKEKFLTKTVKRRDFNDGVKQIEYDFANNVPIEDVVGAGGDAPAADASANDTANDSAVNDTLDESADATLDDTAAEDGAANSTQNDGQVEDSDETGTLVIDEGKEVKKGRKSKADTATPAKTPAKPAKEPKTPRGGRKKEESKEEEGKDDKKEEEIVSRSGRKIRPKRYMDEQTEENATLPSPVVKKRRGGSPDAGKDKPEAKEKTDKPVEKNIKQYNAVSQSEIEDLKEPYKSACADKDSILLCWLPTQQYVGIKLFQSRPSTFGSDASALQWDRQTAANAIKLKIQLEKGQTKPESMLAQLVMDLNLTDEEKAALDKERETDEKKSRVQFLKTEMKLIELDAKIKTCLCLEKADVTQCLKLLDELLELDVKPLMLLKHPTCLETVKRMRAYVGNTTSWDMSESEALQFNKQAHRIRKQADKVYATMKEMYSVPDGLSFWEFFSERVLQFKKATAKLNADELLELVHEPIEMSEPTSHTMKSAIEAANSQDAKAAENDSEKKKKATPVKAKKAPANSTPAKTPQKRQRKQADDKEKDKEKEKEADKEPESEDKSKSDETESKENGEQTVETNEKSDKETNEEQTTKENDTNKEVDEQKEKEDSAEDKRDSNNKEVTNDVSEKDAEVENNPKEIEASDKSDSGKDKEEEVNDSKANEKKEKEQKDKEDKKEKIKEQKGKEKEQKEKEQKEVDEPRAKRSRESKKTEPPPPRSPAKRKSKA